MRAIPVTVSCRVLGFSTTAYHAWRRRPVSQRDWDDAHLINAAVDVHGDDPEFGYRLIADELIHAMGFPVRREPRATTVFAAGHLLKHPQAAWLGEEGRAGRA